MPQLYHSWGLYPRFPQKAKKLEWRNEQLPIDQLEPNTYLPYGNGRSYGDSCLNRDGVLLDTRGLNRFISFSTTTGILRCESGVLLSEILEVFVPKGWFLPVTPGTKFVTVGGAIANDVHGKNHHCVGSFGCHIRCFELLRSDGTRLQCSPQENSEWFYATVGGLGLTGTIIWAEIALKRIISSHLDLETIRFSNLDEFLRLSCESNHNYEYTVGWVDCLAKGRSLGRGVFMRANHATTHNPDQKIPSPRSLTIPIKPPFSLINSLIARAFNVLYYHCHSKQFHQSVSHYDHFFYPLDHIHQWNRLYGKAGFMQYQCVVPTNYGLGPIKEILTRTSISQNGSFLTVIKTFGEIPSPGLLSFPRSGITLALDFPNKGKRTFDLLEELDEIVRLNGGAVYPAKDARMSRKSFQQYYPRWKEFEGFIDPRFSSSFWRRVTKGPV